MNSDLQTNGSMEISVPLEFKTPAEVIQWLREQRTPLDMVETREGRGGKEWHYIRHQYIVETLNRLCNFNWSFRILREWIHEGDDQVTVLGELTIHVAGQDVVKTQYGSSDIKRYIEGRNAGKAMSIGDDLKSAASDALKKCATQIGLGLDLSIPIQSHTLRRLHAAGMQNCEGDKTEWKRKRKYAIQILTGGSKESSKDLSEVEGRILIAAIEKDISAPIVEEFIRKL